MAKLSRDHPSWPEFERRLRAALAADPCTHRSVNRSMAILLEMGLPQDVEAVMPSVRKASSVSGFAECDCRILLGSELEAEPA